ncbi:DNA primase family protein [Levilactobacillus sp. HBUAS70063]|uniref:DNA primase family protein n=1 Tax=Levilactobacillus sp. HBUAS70063 TaxID=3109359 RepID=UPI0031331CF6
MDSLISDLKTEGDPFVRCNEKFVKEIRGGGTGGINASSYADEVRLLCEQAGKIGSIVSSLLGLGSRNESVQLPVVSDAAIQAFKQALRLVIGLITQKSGNFHLDSEKLVIFVLANMKLIVVDDQLLVYNYSEGIYVDATTLGRPIALLLNYSGGDVWTQNAEQKLFELLRRRARKVDADEMNRRYYIFKDKALDLKSLDLVDFSPECLSTMKSQVSPCSMPTPKWGNFLSTTFDDDETATFVQEWMGYQLDREHAGESFLFMISSGASGKSTLLTVMRSLVGGANTTSTKLQQLGGDFGLAPLVGKASLLSDESPDGAFPTDILKLLTTGSPVTVNQKYQDAKEMVLRIKLTFAFNSLPQAEQTIGFERRLILLLFPHTFTEDVANKDLSKQLEREMPGIAFLAIKALRHLRKNGYTFTESVAMKEAKREYLDKGKPNVLKYLERRIHRSQSGRVRKPDIYKDYQSWESRMALPVLSNKQFWREANSYWQQAVRTAKEPVKVRGVDYLDHIRLGDDTDERVSN